MSAILESEKTKQKKKIKLKISDLTNTSGDGFFFIVIKLASEWAKIWKTWNSVVHQTTLIAPKVHQETYLWLLAAEQSSSPGLHSCTELWPREWLVITASVNTRNHNFMMFVSCFHSECGKKITARAAGKGWVGAWSCGRSRGPPLTVTDCHVSAPDKMHAYAIICFG